MSGPLGNPVSRLGYSRKLDSVSVALGCVIVQSHSLAERLVLERASKSLTAPVRPNVYFLNNLGIDYTSNDTKMKAI